MHVCCFSFSLSPLKAENIPDIPLSKITPDTHEEKGRDREGEGERKREEGREREREREEEEESETDESEMLCRLQERNRVLSDGKVGECVCVCVCVCVF